METPLKSNKGSFTCNICKILVKQSGFVLGVKEAFTIAQAVMIRMCERCYQQITNHMIYLAKTLPETDNSVLEWTNADDTALLKSFGISNDIGSPTTKE